MSESVHKLSHNYDHNHKNGSKIKNSGPIKISNYVKLTNKHTCDEPITNHLVCTEQPTKFPHG